MSERLLPDPVICPHCGKVWDPQYDDMVTLFNHAELHAWMEKPAGQRGIFHGCIREVIPPADRQAWLAYWIENELELIHLRTGVSI